MSTESRQQATCDVAAILPNRADDIARLGTLLEHDEPIVTVVEKLQPRKEPRPE